MHESESNHKNKNNTMHFFPSYISYETHNNSMIVGEKQNFVGCPIRIRAYHILVLNYEILSELRFYNFSFFISFFYYPDDDHYDSPNVVIEQSIQVIAWSCHNPRGGQVTRKCMEYLLVPPHHPWPADSHSHQARWSIESQGKPGWVAEKWD